MQEGDFQLFTRQVERRKGEWREYLSQHIMDKKLKDRRFQAQQQGEAVILSREELRPDARELRETEKALRDSHATEGLSSELTELITKFFDLPAVRPKQPSSAPDNVQSKLLRNVTQGIYDDDDLTESAPPSTHPSAGLSYLRSNAVMENHPLHGPQAHPTPFLARVVRPRNSAQGTEYQAKLGLAGFVTQDPVSASLNPGRASTNPSSLSGVQTYDPDTMAHSLDIDLPGGNKMWVHPQSAYVDENGRIRLTVSRGDREAIAVKNNDVEGIHASRAASTRGMVGGMGALPGTAGNANFGYSLAGRQGFVPPTSTGMPRFTGASSQRGGRGQRREEVKGFDEELGRQVGESSLARIQALAEGREKR